MKRILYGTGIAFAALLFVNATHKRDENLKEVFARINQEVLQNSKAYETLGEVCSTIGHRLTGSANGKRAEEFAINLFKKYGYTDAKFQSFEVESWMRDTVSLVIVPRKSDNYREVSVVALAHSPVDAKVTADMVDVGNGLEEDFEAVKDQLKGKIAIANIGLLGESAKGKKNLHRSEKTALAIKHGATGIIMVNTVPGNVLLTGTASVTGSLIPIPAVCVSLESGQKVRDWIKEERLQAVIDMHNFSRKIHARNVIATVKGSGKLAKEKIIIGGHLDSWDLATGATDNGLGSFSIIDIARTFKALNLKTKRTIEFVLFMGEEQGLLGSRALIRELVKTGEVERLRCMMNLDMTNNPKGFNVMGRDEMKPIVQQIGEQIKSIEPEFTNNIANQAGLHSDHQGFMLEGIPTLSPSGVLSSKVYGCYHANCDRFDLVNRQDMMNTVRITTMMIYGLANAAEWPAKKMSSTETRDFLVKQGLKQELVIGKDWRWAE